MLREVAEWSKAHAWKVCIHQKCIEGSNPFLSADYVIYVIYFYIFNIQNIKQKKMKRLFSLLAIVFLMLVQSNQVYAIQNIDNEMSEVIEQIEEQVEELMETQPNVFDETQKLTNKMNKKSSDDEKDKPNFHTVLKDRFIEGGPAFMGIVLLCLILGLAIAIERIIFLNLSSSDSTKLTAEVIKAMDSGGLEAAKEVCRNTPGPVASIFYQGLDRSKEGVESAEKAVIAYGGVQMGKLEKNVSWISLFIALAPMLGFMGTVIGMIEAFDKIEAAGDMQPSLVAGGIKVALLTTVFGLIVAIILQIFYNYIISKIDGLVNDMESASIDLMDMLVNKKK